MASSVKVVSNFLFVIIAFLTLHLPLYYYICLLLQDLSLELPAIHLHPLPLGVILQKPLPINEYVMYNNNLISHILQISIFVDTTRKA